MNEYGQMNEIVGESGQQTGEGCLMGVAATAAVVLTAVAALWAMPAAGATPRKPGACQVAVPDTYGMTEQAAVDALEAKGLSAYVWVNKEASTWLVVHSEPQPGVVVDYCAATQVQIWIGA